MQAVLNSSAAFNPAQRLQFFGSRSYMMRSEKRSRMNPPTSGNSGGGRPPRRRRRRAGFFYKLIMLLLLILIWPVGLLMLWRRKLRWGVGTKLLTSVVTLFACVVLFGFALTADTGNAQYAKIQDSVNGFLDTAADWMVDSSVIVAEKAVYVYDNAVELGDSLWAFSRDKIADGIDAGVKLADAAKLKFAELTDKSEALPTEEPSSEPTEEITEELSAEPTEKVTEEPSAEPTEEVTEEPSGEPTEKVTKEPSAEPTGEITKKPSAEPTEKVTKEPSAEPTEEAELPAVVNLPEIEAAETEEPVVVPSEIPTEEPTAEPTVEPTEEPTAEPTVEPTEEPTAEPTVEPTEEPTAEPTAEPTPVPTAEPIVKPAVNKNATELPVYIPQEAPAVEDGKAIEEGILSPNGLTAGALPTVQPTATPEPVQNVFTLKPASQATVYYNDTGKTYHMTSKCGKMRTAVEHVLGDAANTRHERCTLCETPDKSILDEVYVAWLDESNLVHMSDECSAFDGSWVLQTAAKASADDRVGCTICHADEYLAALDEDLKVTVVAPAEDEIIGPSIYAVAPASVEDGLVTPSVALKAAAEATVYHSSNGKWYHTFNRCQNMTGGKAYALIDCIDDFKTCKKCGAPSGDLIGKPCLWKDEDGLCHTSDECTSFEGRYTLVERDVALDKKMKGCTDCGGDQYLMEGTDINYLQVASVG